MRFFLGLVFGAVITLGGATLLQPLWLDTQDGRPVFAAVAAADHGVDEAVPAALVVEPAAPVVPVAATETAAESEIAAVADTVSAMQTAAVSQIAAASTETAAADVLVGGQPDAEGRGTADPMPADRDTTLAAAGSFDRQMPDTALATAAPPMADEPSVRSVAPEPLPVAGSAEPDRLAATPAARETSRGAAQAANQQTAPRSQTEPAARMAVVWKPFHSEVSASGFARRLSTQLGTAFRTVKQGPAKYYVVFDYVDDAERDLLRGQVAALTGFSVP